jgi:putative ABC transport system substrate-binding protein
VTSRRIFLVTLAGGILAASLAAEAQQAGKVPRIGFLKNSGPGTTEISQREAFLQGLRELGWIDGQTVTIEYRSAEGSVNRLSALAEFVQLKVDVIVLAGPQAIHAVRRATSTIPIVFVTLSDPVTTGLVASLARPGGNMTGLASQYEEIITKQLQLLKEAVPKVSRIVLLQHTEGAATVRSAAEAAAQGLGLTARSIKVGEVAEYENAFRIARREGAEAIHVLPSPSFNAHRARLIDLAARYRLPAIYEFKNYVEDGGLMSYGPSINEMFRGMASYVDRILKGAKPGDLPIERPRTFELVINLKTAKALNLTIPQALLLRADQVIE